MADITGYTINGETKTFADAQARQQISELSTALAGKQDKCLQGHGEPTEEGEYIGQIYLDLDTDKFYIVNSSNEWQLIGSGEEVEEKTPIIITRSESGEWSADDWAKLVTMKNGQAILRLVGDDGSRIHCNPIQAIKETVDGVAVYRCFFYSQFDINHVWRLTYTPSDSPKASDLTAKRIQLALSITPPCVGLVHYVSSSGKTYISKGTSAASDWIEINGGSEPGPEPSDNVLVVDIDDAVYDEVAEAFAESKAVFAKATFANRSVMMTLVSKETGVYVFAGIDDKRNVFWAKLSDDNTWEYSNYSVVSASALTNETQARQNADANLQEQVNNRYTKAQVDAHILKELPIQAKRKSDSTWDVPEDDPDMQHKYKVGNLMVREEHDADGDTVDLLHPVQFNSFFENGLKRWATYFYSKYYKKLYQLLLKVNDDETTNYQVWEWALEGAADPNIEACPGMLYRNTASNTDWLCTKFNDPSGWVKLTQGTPEPEGVLVVTYGEDRWSEVNDAWGGDQPVFCKDVQEGYEVMYPAIRKDTSTGLITFGNALVQFTLSQTNQWHTYTNNFANVKASVAGAPTHVGDIAVTSDKKVYVATGITSASDWKEIGNGGGGEPVEEVFIAEYEETTYDDVKDAYDAGKIVLCRRTLSESAGDYKYALLRSVYGSLSHFYFECTDGGNSHEYILKSNDEWSEKMYTPLPKDDFDAKFLVKTAAPTEAPQVVGCYWFDKTNGKLYVSKGMSSVSDWEEINGGGSGESSVFVAEYGETSFDEVKAASDAGKVVLVHVEDGSDEWVCVLNDIVIKTGESTAVFVADKDDDTRLSPCVTKATEEGEDDSWVKYKHKLVSSVDIMSKFKIEAGAPTTAPSAENCYWFDKTNEKLYVSKGTSSVSDWVDVAKSEICVVKYDKTDETADASFEKLVDAYENDIPIFLQVDEIDDEHQVGNHLGHQLVPLSVAQKFDGTSDNPSYYFYFYRAIPDNSNFELSLDTVRSPLHVGAMDRFYIHGDKESGTSGWARGLEFTGLVGRSYLTSTDDINEWTPACAGNIAFKGRTLWMSRSNGKGDWSEVVFKSDVDAKFTEGSGAPTGTPSASNLYYFDKTNGDLYVSNGTSSASDWNKIGGGSGDSEVFFAMVNTTSYNDIKAAYDGGKKVFAVDGTSGFIYSCCVFASNTFIFTGVLSTAVNQCSVSASVGWLKSSFPLALTITVNSSTAADDYSKVKSMLSSSIPVAVFAVDPNDYDTVWRALWQDSTSVHFGCFEFEGGSPKMFFRELKSTGWTAEQECSLAEYKDVEPIVDKLEGLDTCSIKMDTDDIHEDFEVYNFRGMMPPVLKGHNSSEMNQLDVSWMLHWSNVENQSGDPENGPWSVSAVYLAPDRLRMVQINFEAEWIDGNLSITNWSQDFRSLTVSGSNPPSFRPPCAGLVAFVKDSIWMTNSGGDWVQIGG